MSEQPASPFCVTCGSRPKPADAREHEGKLYHDWHVPKPTVVQPPPLARPRVVTLCGSTRFKQAFIEANFRETMAGRIVLTVGWYSHADAETYTPTPEEKRRLDALHLAKIDLSDEILVINVGGYVGESTAREIAHARSLGKPIRWLEAEA